MNCVLPPTKRTFYIRRRQFSILLRRVNIRDNLRDTAGGGSGGFPLLWRRFWTRGADVSRVLVTGALVTMGADLDHTSAGDGAGSGRGSRLFHLGIVGFIFTVVTTVEES